MDVDMDYDLSVPPKPAALDFNLEVEPEGVMERAKRWGLNSEDGDEGLAVCRKEEIPPSPDLTALLGSHRHTLAYHAEVKRRRSSSPR